MSYSVGMDIEIASHKCAYDTGLCAKSKVYKAKYQVKTGGDWDSA